MAMAETREESGRLDKEERNGQHSNYSTTPLWTSTPYNTTYPFITSTSSIEAVNAASDDEPRYDAANNEYQPLGFPTFIFLPPYSAVEHIPASSSTTPLYDLTNTYDNTNTSNYEQQLEDLSLWTNNTGQTPEVNNASAVLSQAAPSISLFGIQPSCFHYSHVIREDSHGISAVLTLGLTLAGLTMTPTKITAVAEHTNIPPTVYSDTLEAFTGSATDFDSEATLPRVSQHALERHQLQAWMHQSTDESMTISEKLEKDKRNWNICPS